ncbi:hypothetical protein F2Q70_00038514 [Brassica cretica]|uniref:Uncharacterized protein n=1 Tax=Brassica cretica TaxID=69181 RepID=A0A8S9K699_BRACR|nr:hypothetical protein F2Q70_00038514 [Brassica cretica]KAF2620443.1 hypothetical protein F2Q68_00039145 [Brassica cretica]
MCSLGRIGVITSLRTSGFPCDLRVQIQQGPDRISGSKGTPRTHTRPQGPISKTSGFQLDPQIYHRISGFLHRLRAPVMIPGSIEGPLGPKAI